MRIPLHWLPGQQTCLFRVSHLTIFRKETPKSPKQSYHINPVAKVEGKTNNVGTLL